MMKENLLVIKVRFLCYFNKFKFYFLSNVCMYIEGGFKIVWVMYNMIRLFYILERFFKWYDGFFEGG